VGAFVGLTTKYRITGPPTWRRRDLERSRSVVDTHHQRDEPDRYQAIVVLSDQHRRRVVPSDPADGATSDRTGRTASARSSRSRSILLTFRTWCGSASLCRGNGLGVLWGDRLRPDATPRPPSHRFCWRRCLGCRPAQLVGGRAGGRRAGTAFATCVDLTRRWRSPALLRSAVLVSARSAPARRRILPGRASSGRTAVSPIRCSHGFTAICLNPRVPGAVGSSRRHGRLQLVVTQSRSV
jgi:hypothetical protein